MRDDVPRFCYHQSKIVYQKGVAMNVHFRIGLVSLYLVGCGMATLRAETPEEWVKLGARVHGGFGAFIPVGIRIGEDAMKRLNAQPRELSVVYYSGEGVPCPCSVDGVMLAVSASGYAASLKSPMDPTETSARVRQLLWSLPRRKLEPIRSPV
jgi:hypothetical protein